MVDRHPKRSVRPRLRFTDEEVEKVVEEALDSLPPEFAELLENIFVMVEAEPSDEDLKEVGMIPEERHTLFGMYQGVPLTERESFYQSALPDRVVIYAETIRHLCRTRREAIDEVRKTLLHELGHYFGMTEEDMPY